MPHRRSTALTTTAIQNNSFTDNQNSSVLPFNQLDIQLWKERIDKMPFYGVKLPKLQAVWTGYGRILPLEK